MSSAKDQKSFLESQLDDMSSFLDKAIDDVGNMKSISLGKMEQQIHDLCKKIESSDPAIAHAMKPGMADIISKLDELAQRLDEYKSKIEKTGT